MGAPVDNQTKVHGEQMTRGICLQCGAEKGPAFTPCGRCGFVPQAEEERAKSVILTDHYFTLDRLRELGATIASGKPPDIDPQWVQMHIQALREDPYSRQSAIAAPDPDIVSTGSNSSNRGGWPDISGPEDASARVQPFTHAMIENYLQRKNLRYSRDPEGDFEVRFKFDERFGGGMTYHLEVGGSDKDIYSIRGHRDKPVPRSHWNHAVHICNDWNMNYRWPKAFLLADRETSDEYAGIVLVEQFPLTVGIHQALLDDFTDTVISVSGKFWEWAHGSAGL